MNAMVLACGRYRAAAYWTVLAILLAMALYMRVANLGDVQHFEGDQGGNYVEVMKWLKDGGPWPLLGPRRYVGDNSLGPGWFYTLAPALALTNYHPAAGAATIAILAVLTIFLCAEWIRRDTGSRAAALVTAGIIAFSGPWTVLGRTLWSPNALPFAVAALAWLMVLLPRRPVPYMALALALVAILPQWHTTGLLVSAAALAPLALSWRAARPAIATTARRTWVLWGGALAAGIALLYVPPLIHELKPGPGNIASFVSKTNIPARPNAGASPQRGLRAFDKLVRRAAHQNFLVPRKFASTKVMVLRLSVGIGGAAIFGLLYVAALRQRGIDASASFIALLLAGYWLVLMLKGDVVPDYCIVPAYLAMLMLGGWTVGRLLGHAPADHDDSRPILRYAPILGRALAVVALLLAGGLSLAQLPRAWAIHEGVARHRHNLGATREAAEFIASDSEGAPYSVALADGHKHAAHFHYLLRRLGRPPQNEDYFSRRILRQDMGQTIYVIAASALARAPRLEGLPGPTVALDMDDYRIYRLKVASLPSQVRAVTFVVDSPDWVIRAER